MALDIRAGFPAFETEEMAGRGQALMHVEAEAALLLPGRCDAIMSCGDKARPVGGPDTGTGDDEDGIGHAEAGSICSWRVPPVRDDLQARCRRRKYMVNNCLSSKIR